MAFNATLLWSVTIISYAYNVLKFYTTINLQIMQRIVISIITMWLLKMTPFRNVGWPFPCWTLVWKYESINWPQFGNPWVVGLYGLFWSIVAWKTSVRNRTKHSWFIIYVTSSSLSGASTNMVIPCNNSLRHYACLPMVSTLCLSSL